ncbi:unnamed protein product [Cyprideis torosa]|uniref:arginine kinase n=1 Tax=Cyprideis torosa TaxID=163714 RepID=A0A7R8ZLW7_9CRUS|nr:unnamed protein product [Cyprideis torosa]CAG0883039.1 unnamed protein product [Cyprideis torosa]
MVDPTVLAKLESGFQKLEASNSKSLLKKHLTREIFDRLKDRKTKLGATLLDVIQSGLENHDSGVGVYAPDAESYTVFADLFDPIIEEYHKGFKKTDKHPPCDLGDVSTLKNVDPEGKYVISTRVRCGRSMEGYPFNPCLTEAMYKEMEEKVSSTLKALTGELKGTYHPLTGMSKEVQQQLIDDHFLFKEGDRFLQAANACRYWPTGRGIYHNDNKTFLVWVNEEDHMRIISMQKGGDLAQVYGRLVNAVKSIEKLIPFSHNDRLGFLTFCPTNLGTTIRASVHIGLPKLAADYSKLEEVAAKYNLQVRGTRGEHTESEGGIYDISNKRRMGLTEYQAMVDSAVMAKLEAGFQKLEASDSKSLLKKHLTREIFDRLKDRKTKLGATLLDVIQSGIENPDSGVGVYAPDAESYTVFADLFDPIIEEYHKGFKKTDKHPPCDLGDVSTLKNVDPEGKYVISTRVRCGRSMEGYPFNPCLTEAMYKEMEEKVSSTLKALTGELKGTYHPLTGMSKEVQQQLIDDHFLFKEGDRFLQAANACRYWPTGRGIYHNDNKTFLVWVNEEDHMRIISMQKGGDLAQVYGRLVNAVKSIEKLIPFSHNDRLGFLTFCPTNLGTTIRASVHIGLPKLAADYSKLEEVAAKYNLQVRGTRGEHTESEGGIYDISNKRRMGLTEYQAVQEMQDGILEMIKMEKEL